MSDIGDEIKIPELSTDTATHILDNVFAANDQPSSSIPIEALEEWDNFRKRSFRLPVIVCLVFLILIILVPLMFLRPSVTLTRMNVSETAMSSTAKYEADISTFLPVSEFRASLNGDALEASRLGRYRYSVEFNANGTLEIYVRIANGQYTVYKKEVNFIDSEKPVLVSSEVDKDYLYLTFIDTFSGIDWGSVSVTDMNGSPVSVESLETVSGVIKLDLPYDPVLITVPDNAGNKLLLQIAMPKTEDTP